MVDESGSIRRLTVAHSDPAKEKWGDELAEKYPPDQEAPYGVPNVIRTGQSELFTEIPTSSSRKPRRLGRSCSRFCASSA